jgi:two-component system NtrC family sensor kinase
LPGFRVTVLWHLRAVVVASLLGPLLMFGYAGWSNYEAADEHASERLERALDILQEHALKAVQTIELTIAETNEILGSRSDEQIRSEEAALSARLAVVHSPLSHIQSIWAFDRNGAPLVSSTVLPVPSHLNNSDRDYFRAQVDQHRGTYLGGVIQARVGDLRFFVVSRRRPEAASGSFNGVIGVTVVPDDLLSFYARLAPTVANIFTLMRRDGTVLARYPRPPGATRLTAQSQLMKAIEAGPTSGMLTAASEVDGVERRVSYRSLPGYPAYIVAGVDTAAIWNEAWLASRGELAFGLPATLAMFVLALHALRRTQRYEAETARREQAEVALKQAQRLEALGQLTGGVAHDFNNILMVVSGNVERLKGELPQDRRRRALDAIETATRRGATLTRHLLSFSRRQTHEPGPVDLSKQLGGLQEMLQSSLRGNIKVDVRVGESVWPIMVDASEFELAVLNIAVNARDAMPNGGVISISAQNATLRDPETIGLAGEFVCLSIADSGTGIPPQVLSRVFEPFFTTKEVGKGTGLGLSQVYGFAQQSGGTVTVDSRPGQGTSVTLYLPRASEPPSKQAPEAEVTQPSLRPGRGQILLVEDNPEVAEVTQTRLEQLGFQVVHAADAMTARVRVSELSRSLDLVVSDIVMPGDLNGLDLARIVRRETGGRLPVLLATGYSDVAQQAIDEGFPVLRKPFDSRQLHDGIAGVLRTERLRVVS